MFKGVKAFKNEWADRYDEAAFKVDIDPGKIPHFIYYDAEGTEITREKYEDTSAEEVAEILASHGILPSSQAAGGHDEP